eukprot:914350-Alexandrium_andersonii.AAC.1
MHELQRELSRVEAQTEAAHVRLAEQARQEVALAQTVLANTQGQSEQAQNRAQVLERRLEIAAGLLTDNEELREQAKAKDAQCADMRRQMGEQRALFEQQLAAMKSQMEEPVSYTHLRAHETSAHL